MEARFVTSAFGLDQRPQPVLPEFAFIGRSNCGKSSLINLYLGRSGLAQTSRTPGRTRSLNYFLVEERYYLVDLPGYGFARAGREERRRWQALVRGYLASADRPLAVFHLLDVRHRPTAADVEMSRWLHEAGHPLGVAVTKVDKVARGRLPGRYAEIIGALDLPPATPFFPTSARQGSGGEEMRAWVDARLAALAGGQPEDGGSAVRGTEGARSGLPDD